MSLLVNYLETHLANEIMNGVKRKIYSAYLWRAVVRMLYTSGLRNAELRSLTDADIQIEQLKGTIL
jgi:integrase